MKCDDFLAARDSKSAWQQWRARLHARRCPTCAATARVAAELERELSQVEPLTPAQRELWEQAIAEKVTPSVLPARTSQFGALALAAIVLLGVTAAIVGWQGGGRRAAPPQVAQDNSQPGQEAPAVATIRTIDASGELDELLASVKALAAELDATTRKAELLDARRRAETMIATFNQW